VCPNAASEGVRASLPPTATLGLVVVQRQERSAVCAHSGAPLSRLSNIHAASDGNTGQGVVQKCLIAYAGNAVVE